jgi:DNA-binding Xre family transcriptional regulator
MLKARNISIYRLKSDKVIGTATLDKIRKGEGHIDTRSIESLCRYLNCQPGDIMEYVEDNATNENNR